MRGVWDGTKTVDVLNMDLESNPRPRISLKIGYFLTDTTVEGSGNFYVIPGSHLWKRVRFAGR